MSDEHPDLDDLDSADEPQFEWNIVDPLDQVLERSEQPDEVWLWCIYCERFFQAKHLRIDYLGNRQGCAFCRCAGFNVAIHEWNTFWHDGEEEPWPKSTRELYHGRRLHPEGPAWKQEWKEE